jgi:hypothetical protein
VSGKKNKQAYQIMKIVYRANDITEAHIVKGLLESNGIEVYIGGYYLQGGVGDLAPRDFAHVHVADENQHRAIEIISEYEGATNSESSNKKPNETTLFIQITIMAIIAISIILIYLLATQ